MLILSMINNLLRSEMSSCCVKINHIFDNKTIKTDTGTAAGSSFFLFSTILFLMI